MVLREQDVHSYRMARAKKIEIRLRCVETHFFNCGKKSLKRCSTGVVEDISAIPRRLVNVLSLPS